MSAHDFKPDYIDGFGDPFRCVFPEESQKIPLLIFKIEDIDSFEDVFGFGKTEDKPVPDTEPRISATKQDPEDFIRNLRVCRKNDIEIMIQEPSKSAVDFGFKILRFQSNRTKEWQTLIDILQDPHHTYDVGSPSSKTYDNKRGYLRDSIKNLSII